MCAKTLFIAKQPVCSRHLDQLLLLLLLEKLHRRRRRRHRVIYYYHFCNNIHATHQLC